MTFVPPVIKSAAHSLQAAAAFTPNVEEAFNNPYADYTQLKEAFYQMLLHWKEEQPIRLEDGSLFIAFSVSTPITCGPALQALCDCLKQCTSIHTLIFHRCRFFGKSLEQFLDSFMPEAKLSHLFLVESPLGDAQFAELAAKPWLMKRLSSFFYLDNPMNRVEDISGICGLVESAANLNELGIDGCRLTDPMVARLAQTFFTVTPLQHLSLSQNCITDNGALQLATGLRRNITLRFLDLSENSLSSKTLQGLAMSFAKHPNPLRIKFGANSGEVTEVEINDLFDRVPHLEGLDLSQHPKLSAAIVINNALKRAHHLTQLDLKATRFTDGDARALLNAKRQRKESAPPLHVHVLADKINPANRKALCASRLGAIFHLYVRRQPSPPNPPGLLDEIRSAQTPSETLLSKALQLPVATLQEMEFKTSCFHALLSKVFDVVEIPKDGNCLFRCFELSLQTTELKDVALDKESLREESVDYIAAHMKDFLEFFAPLGKEDVSCEALLKQHCGNMYENNVWAGQTEIKALYEWLKSKGIPRSVVLYHMHSLMLEEQGFRPHLTWGDPIQEEPIYLFFENESHYTLLRKKSAK